jgi:hypothetical protein
MGDKGGTGQYHMPFFLKEIEEKLPDLIAVQVPSFSRKEAFYRF